MFRVDIFSSQLAPNVKPGVIHVIKYADMQLRRLDTQKVTLKSLVVAIPSSISVDLTCSALRASSAIVLEVEGLDMHGYYSLLIEHASFEEQQHILKTYYGCQITNESVFYILPIAELDFHEINFRAKFEGETLPCCPACLERIDFIDFPHNIWFKPSGWCSTVPLSNCKVCMTVHQSLGSQRIFSCLDCQETSDLQICMICGAIGCSRYQAAHAKRHSDETGHTLCMDIDSGRIWDYPNDQYRHRRLKTGEISLDWKFAKADVKDERMGLLTTEFPEEFSTLNALKCALRHSVENEETEEAKQLEALINEWMNWLDHFVTELMKRKSNFEYSLEAIEHDATSKAAQLEKEILRLQESKASIGDRHAAKYRMKKKRKKLNQLMKQVDSLEEERDMLKISLAASVASQSNTSHVDPEEQALKKLELKVAETMFKNSKLASQIEEAYKKLDDNK